MLKQSAQTEQPAGEQPAGGTPSLTTPLRQLARVALAAATSGTWVSLGVLLLAGDRLLRERTRPEELADLYV